LGGYGGGSEVSFDREDGVPAADGSRRFERVDTVARACGEPPVGGRAEIIEQLQRSAGNQAVARMLAARTAPLRPPPEAPHEAASRYRSPALELRSLLRRRVADNRIVQRAVTTSGGTWDTDKFDLLKDRDAAGNAFAAAAGVRGVDIKLKFTPNATVDAELIGLSQSVQSFVNNTPNLTPAAATRAIPASDAKPINTGSGETDEGTAIDRAQGFNNPVYAVQSTASTSLADTNTLASWGQLGFHYKDSTNTLKQQDATLMDSPIRGGATKDSRQVFEVTALATKGAQSGTYYGSVRWGWRTDSAGKFTKIDLQMVSEGVPSSAFLKAGEIWNKGKSSTGAANVKLPIPDVKVTTGAVNLLQRPPLLGIALPVGTRLQVLQEWHPPLVSGRVKVVDGPNTGAEGEVHHTEWPNIADERS
jgi:hypothetical protein